MVFMAFATNILYELAVRESTAGSWPSPSGEGVHPSVTGSRAIKRFPDSFETSKWASES